MSKSPIFSNVVKPEELTRQGGNLKELVQSLYQSGLFIFRRPPSDVLRPMTGRVAVALQWDILNRVDVTTDSVVQLPRIDPKHVGVPLYFIKRTARGTMTVLPTGKPTPTVDGGMSVVCWAPGLYIAITDGQNWNINTGSRDTQFDVTHFGASPAAPPAVNDVAIQAAIDAAEANGGGVVVFPGNAATRYQVSTGFTVTESYVRLSAPGRAKLKLMADTNVNIAVGDIETGINLSQSNTLASNALAGATSVTLSAGKGGNITAGSWIMIKSTAVVPEHDAAVVNKRAEFINVYSVAGDVLTLAAPLRFTYNTADTAEVYVIDWIEGFAIDGLGLDGNSQQPQKIGYQMSWCLRPQITNVEATNIQQRFVRFQGCLQHYANNVSQQNGLSDGFNGDSGHFAYMTAEQGLCQDGQIGDLTADRCRHGYTTGAGWTTNAAITSGIISGIGVPMDSIIGPGVHHNSRGAGWDTHEVGMNITWRGLKTLGSLQIGFQARSVRTRLLGCYARDCVGAAIQIGSDGQQTYLDDAFDWENTNTGTDPAGTDWTKISPIQDNGVGTVLGTPRQNELDNGNFEIWDRATSFTAAGSVCNRWRLALGSGAAVTVSRRDQANADAYRGKYYLRFNRGTTGSTASTLSQYRDDVRSFAGQRIVLSCRMRDSVDGTDLNFYLTQYFGTGGGPSADVTTTAQVRRIDGNWRRYSIVFDVPSIDGKTIGSNEDSALIFVIEYPTAGGANFWDIEWAKCEVNHMPTDFIAKSPEDDRADCERWYIKSFSDGVFPGSASSVGRVQQFSLFANANYYRTNVYFPTRMARIPIVTFYAPSSGSSGMMRDVTSASGIDIACSTTSIGHLGFHGGATNSTGIASGITSQFQYTAHVPEFQ